MPTQQQTPVVLLPGLDGTGNLFKPFLDACPKRFKPTVISYPPNRFLSYDDLYAYILDCLPQQPFLLIGESFSGPLAIKIAASFPGKVLGVVLAASFICSPIPSWTRPLLRFVPLHSGVAFKPAQFFLLGTIKTTALSNLLVNTIRRVPIRIIQNRLKSIIGINVSEELRQLHRPILYLKPSNDMLVSTTSLKRIQTIKPSTAVSIVKAPHLILQTAPKMCWDHILVFTNRINAL